MPTLFECNRKGSYEMFIFLISIVVFVLPCFAAILIHGSPVEVMPTEDSAFIQKHYKL